MRYLFCSYDIEKLRTLCTTHISVGRYGYSLYGINDTEICFSYKSLGLVHQNIFNNLPAGYFILTVDSVPFYAFTARGLLYRQTTPGNILEVNRDNVAERYPLYQEDDLVWDEYNTLKYSNNELYISSMGSKTIWTNKDLDISNLDCLTNSYQLPEDEYKFDIQERKLLSMIL
tara:strand:+ start:1431 stop:1949 length:519 start_codon:yes stop_codon:yes gene_type:complete